MTHDTKICACCGDPFTPRPTLSKAQAQRQEACDHVCAAALRRRRFRGKERSADQRIVGERDLWRCSSCAAGRAAAAERMAKLPPRPKLSPAVLAKRAALIRRRLLEEPSLGGG